jgi:hypothetical protein
LGRPVEEIPVSAEKSSDCSPVVIRAFTALLSHSQQHKQILLAIHAQPLRQTLREGEHRLRVGTAGTAYALKEERVTVVRGQLRKVDWTLDEQFGRLVVLTDKVNQHLMGL